MTGWLAQAQARPAGVLVTVCAVEGSAPREAGTKMLVWAEGQEGTVGGGNLEFVITGQARKMLSEGRAHRFQSYPLGPLLGQCCGGRVGILLERIEAGAAWLGDCARLEEAGRPYAVHSRFSGSGVEKRVVDLGGTDALDEAPVRLFDAAGRPLTQPRADSTLATMVERIDPRPLVMMFGAGHVGKALAPVLKTLPLRVRWYDSREEFAQEGAEMAADLVALADAAPSGALFLVFTQSHELDYALTRAVLGRGDFAYCGLIGSATKRARFERRLIADGMPRAMLARLTCPIGAIGLTSKAPEVLAIAVAAELLLVVQSRAAARQPKTAHGN